MDETYTSVPVGSLIVLPREKASAYVERVARLPAPLRAILFDPKTGAFVRGLVKNAQLPAAKAQVVAFTLLRIGVGEIHLSQCAETLARELGMEMSKAQAMAREIERELLAPVLVHLSPSARSRNATPLSSAADLPNVLNLKEKRRPPAPPMPPLKRQ